MRQSWNWLCGAALVFTLAGHALADQFPTLKFDTLDGQHLTMPAAAQAGPALFIVGFTRGSNEQTSYWAKHIPRDLVNTYSVAVLEDAPRLVRGMAVHGIKSGVAKDRYDHFLLLYNNENELKETAQFKAPEEAYLILIAPDGSVKWRFHGPFTHTALKDLRDQLHGMRQ